MNAFRTSILAAACAFGLAGCLTFTPIQPRTVKEVLDERVKSNSRIESSIAPEISRGNEAARMGRDPDRPAMPPVPRAESGVIAELRPDDALRAGEGAPARGKGARPSGVTLRFIEPTSLEKIVEAVLGDYLKLSYTFHESFKDKKVRLYLNAEATREEFIHMFDAFLLSQGVKLRYIDGVYQIAMEDRAKHASPSPDGIGEVVGVFRPRFLDVKDVLPIVRQLLTQTDRAHQLPAVNGLVLIAPGAEVRAVERLLAEIDVAYFQGKSVIVYAPRHLTPKGLVQVLDQYQDSLGSTAQKPNKQFEVREVPDRDRVVIVAANEQARKLVLAFLDGADAPARNQRQVFQYQLTTQKAPDLVQPVSTLLKQALRGSPDIVPVADKESNRLFFYATPDEYARIRSLLAHFDARTSLVHLEIMIAEVVLNDKLQYGVEWFLTNSLAGTFTDLTASLPSTTALGSTGAALTLLGKTSNRFLTLQLLENVTYYNILASPQVMARSGSTAKISVGGEEPTVESKLVTPAQTGGSTLPQSNYGKQKVGLDLEITPLVGVDGDIHLEIKLKDTRIAGFTSPDGVVSLPRLVTRDLQTKLIAGDGRTVFLGGIRQRRNETGTNKFPVLGDLPGILGALFRSGDERSEVTELIMLVTPTILYDNQGADTITRAIINASRAEDYYGVAQEKRKSNPQPPADVPPQSPAEPAQ